MNDNITADTETYELLEELTNDAVELINELEHPLIQRALKACVNDMEACLDHSDIRGAAQIGIRLIRIMTPFTENEAILYALAAAELCLKDAMLQFDKNIFANAA